MTQKTHDYLRQVFDVLERETFDDILEFWSTIKQVYDEGYAAGLTKVMDAHSEHEYDAGYHAGYAARDKLSCASCGDGGKPVDRG